ncbi:MAG: PepSY domain-containing protein [Lachnospiraceae bacterium]|nr:PepSY domain-containing protein [Lachnospiraceae bacterium]
MANPEKLSDEMMEQVAGGTLTKDEALEKALAHAHLKRNEVDYVKKVELDYEHGRKVYEVSFYKNGYEYEYDIDAETGKVLKAEKDLDD